MIDAEAKRKLLLVAVNLMIRYEADVELEEICFDAGVQREALLEIWPTKETMIADLIGRISTLSATWESSENHNATPLSKQHDGHKEAPNRQILLNFVEAINAHDPARICALMSEDHIFRDAYGLEENKTAMEQGWPGYFAWFPDYRIEIEQLFSEDDRYAIFGWASGTFHGDNTPGDNHWRLPAAWRAVIRDGKVQLWQVCCDSKLPYEILGRNGIPS